MDYDQEYLLVAVAVALAGVIGSAAQVKLTTVDLGASGNEKEKT